MGSLVGGVNILVGDVAKHFLEEWMANVLGDVVAKKTLRWLGGQKLGGGRRLRWQKIFWGGIPHILGSEFAKRNLGCSG